MKTNNPLELKNIELCNNPADSGLELRLPAYEEFDSRSDFEFDSNQKTMSALLTLANRRTLSDRGNKAGLRRKVSASIVDVTSGEIRQTATLGVSIPRDEYIRVYRIDLPFGATGIKPDHSYELVIRDECSKRKLGEKSFNMFNLDKLGRSYEWYKAESGGVIPEWTDEICRTVCVDRTTKHFVRFSLRTNFREDPITLPELEIRVYRPDGEIRSSFVKPRADRADRELYNAETSILIDTYNTGVCYAELLCMDYPVAGFVFSTDDSADFGAWEGRHLEAMDEYTPAAARRRLRESLREIKGEDYGREEKVIEDYDFDNDDDVTDLDDNNSSEGLSDIDFEAALDRFIMAEDEKLLNTEPEDSDSTDECEDADEEDNGCSCQDNAEAVISEPEPLLSLDHLTGLRSVKEKLRVYEHVVRFNKMRADSGLPHISMPLHAMFTGSPGTGKTTVAKMMGVMLRRAGVLSKGHVVVKERATLLGQNYNSESEKTLQAIEEAQGGILFIDEAYQLFQPNDSRDPGKFVIETLLTSLADENMRDWMLILAGYPDEMRRMLDMNPGFKSRIPESNIYTFDDFSAGELMDIADNYLSRNRYSLTADAREAFAERLASDRKDCGHRSFGNARHVINMIQSEILPAMAVRVISQGTPDDKALTEITRADIPLPVTRRTTDRPRIGYAV